MVGEIWIFVSNCGIYCSLDSWHCWFSNKNWEDFSLARISTNLKRYCLQLDNLDKINFASKHWPNDPRLGYSSPFSLIELIEIDVAL